MSLLIVLSGCDSVRPPPVAAEAAVRHYHDGKQMVSVRVMLDRLMVQRASQEGRPAVVEVIMLRTPVVAAAELEAVARQMREAQPDIMAMSAYVSQVDAPQAQPQRLTRRFALQLSAGTDPAPVLERVAARIVEVVAYSANTYLCEAESSTLLSALDAAAALAQTPGVVFATPQIERMQSHR